MKKVNAEQTNAADQHKPSPPGLTAQSGRAVLWVLIALFVLGIASLVYGLSSETNQPDFGLFTVSFLFLMGVSQAGVVFCAISRLVRAQWAKPYYRLAELSTLAFFPFAVLGLLLLYFYAKDDLFYWLTAAPDDHLSPWLNINWLLVRNLFGLLLFYGLSAIYVAKSLGPDLVPASHREKIDHREVERQLYVLSPLVIIGFVVCNTLFAWDFGMMLIPHWHSTVFPIFFWFGNLFAGVAAMIVFPVLLGRSKIAGSSEGFLSRTAEGSFFGPDQIRYLGMLVTAFTLLWLYFYWSQFFVIWFGNLPHEADPLWKQMYGHYAPYYWTMMTGCFFVPFVALLFAIVKRSLLAMGLIGFSINVGIWVSKYLMVVPALSPDDRPFDHWLEVSLSVGLLAGFLAVMILLINRLPIYSYWEISLKPESRR